MDAKIEALVEAWDEGQWEFSLVFEGLSDEDLWKRAHPNLLSIGELAGHVAFGEAQMFPAGAIESPFFDKAFDYYPRQVAAPLTKDLTVQQVLNELKKVHVLAPVEVRRRAERRRQGDDAQLRRPRHGGGRVRPPTTATSSRSSTRTIAKWSRSANRKTVHGPSS
jgi:hypothetical protein